MEIGTKKFFRADIYLAVYLTKDKSEYNPLAIK